MTSLNTYLLRNRKLLAGLFLGALFIAGCTQAPLSDYETVLSEQNEGKVSLDVVERIRLDKQELGFGYLYRFEGSEDTYHYLDRKSGTVNVFSEEGNLLRAFGAKGEGPGEFLQLASIAKLSDGSILALDTKLNKISHFDAQGQLTWDRRLDLELPSGKSLVLLTRNDLILADDEQSFFVLTDPFENDMNREMYTDSLIVSRYDLQGNWVEAFGKYDPIFAEKISIHQLSNRSLVRSRSGDQLAYIQGATPYVYIHDLKQDKAYKFGRLGSHFKQASHGIDTDKMEGQREFIRKYSQMGKVFSFQSGWAVIYTTPDEEQDPNSFVTAHKKYIQVYDQDFNQIGDDLLFERDLGLYISHVDNEGNLYALKFEDGVEVVKLNLSIDSDGQCAKFI